MHLVTIKVKVDSSLLINIIVSIKVILVLVEGFYLFQNLNIKLPSTFVMRRKKVKRVLYFVPALTGVYLPPVLNLQWFYINHFPWLWWIVSSHLVASHCNNCTERTVSLVVSYSYRSTYASPPLCLGINNSTVVGHVISTRQYRSYLIYIV
jgi:hypothetical protein